MSSETRSVFMSPWVMDVSRNSNDLLVKSMPMGTASLLSWRGPAALKVLHILGCEVESWYLLCSVISCIYITHKAMQVRPGFPAP